MRSSSSLRTLPLGLKVSEAFALLRMHLQRRHLDVGHYPYDALIAEYSSILERHGRGAIGGQRVLEIGFGARPFRLAWLFNRGIDVTGVDLDMPLVKWTPLNMLRVARASGWMRAGKSSLRYFISDTKEWRFLADLFRKEHGTNFRFPADRLVVADASTDEFWDRAGKFSFIYSEDVFEHIPKEHLQNLVRRMAASLRPDGLAVIRPTVFTGITGGHHLEWYAHKVPELDAARSTEPWEHLRQNRRPANTFLNGMTRREYVELFTPHFEILENRAMHPDLGREYMTDAIRAELSAYGDDELFSNSTLFVLAPRH
ncbi:MAG: methyltransferase domain-containing protein [Alphaproteobacteria bacterium]